MFMPTAYALFVKIVVKTKGILCFLILFLLYGRDVLFVLDRFFERFNTLPESLPQAPAVFPAQRRSKRSVG